MDLEVMPASSQVRAPSSGPAQDVTHAAHRLEKHGCRGVLLQLAAEPVHVDVDGPRLARVVVAPDALEELVAREHLALVAEQEREQLEGLRLDRHRLAVA